MVDSVIIAPSRASGYVSATVTTSPGASEGVTTIRVDFESTNCWYIQGIVVNRTHGAPGNLTTEDTSYPPDSKTSDLNGSAGYFTIPEFENWGDYRMTNIVNSITLQFLRRTHLIINNGTESAPGAILRVAGGRILRDDTWE